MNYLKEGPCLRLLIWEDNYIRGHSYIEKSGQLRSYSFVMRVWKHVWRHSWHDNIIWRLESKDFAFDILLISAFLAALKCQY